MLNKPTQAIESEAFAEYDRDYVGFCTRVYEEMTVTNPGMAEVFDLLMKQVKEGNRELILGIQMASLVYYQLKKANGGALPIIEMREALRASALEALADPEAFYNKYGTPYFYSGLITKMTFAAIVCDSVGHGVDTHLVAFVVILMIRLLETQLELDMKKRPVA